MLRAAIVADALPSGVDDLRARAAIAAEAVAAVPFEQGAGGCDAAAVEGVEGSRPAARKSSNTPRPAMGEILDAEGGGHFQREDGRAFMSSRRGRREWPWG